MERSHREVSPGQHWVPALADVVLALGKPYFWDRLSLSVGLMLRNDGIVIFRYQSDREPAFVFSDYTDQVARNEFRQYRTSAYLLDPFYIAYLDRRLKNVQLLRDLVADRFFSSEYYRSYYRRTRLVDEAGLFCWVKPDDLIILSIARREGGSHFSASSIREFRTFAPLVVNLVRRHVEVCALPANEMRPAAPEKTGKVLQFGEAGALTQRETMIANLILRGHSSRSIALLLGISLDTVKTHRRHMYRKLNISSQAELFSLIVKQTIAEE